MKAMGLVLLIVGVLALAYQGFTYTTKEKVIDLGPVEVKKETRRSIPIPPVIGGIALLGGAALLMTGSKK